MQVHDIIGCGNNFSYIFFISFIVILTWLIMNLSIAVVIYGFDIAVIEYWFNLNREKTVWV
jgi:hypothetical protein